MPKMLIDVDSDFFDGMVRDALRQTYVDTITTWKKEADSEMLADALLVVLRHYTAHSDHDKWLGGLDE